MTDTTADMILVSNALAGCQRSWSEIVRVHSDNLSQTIFKDLDIIGYDKSDIMQHFWMSLYETRLVKYNGKSPLNYWMKRELAGSIASLRRRCQRQRAQINANSVPINDSMPDDDLKHMDTPENVLLASQAITPAKPCEESIEQVINSLFASGISVIDISESTGMSAKRISDWKCGRAISKGGDTAKRLIEFNAQVMARKSMEFAAVNWQAC